MVQQLALRWQIGVTEAVLLCGIWEVQSFAGVCELRAYCFCSFNSATMHLAIATLLLIAPLNTCHATAEAKDRDKP